MIHQSVSRSPHQRRIRAITKTLCYRIIMVLITIFVAFFVTNNAGAALSIGFVTNATKTVTYYSYERLWDRITWGLDDN